MALVTVAGHFTALLALLLWPGPLLAMAFPALGVGLSLVLTLSRPWPVRLSRLRDGTWELRCSNGRITRGNISSGRIVGNVISVTLGGRQGRTALLMPDAFRDGGHNRLRGWLRHRRGGASC